MFQNSEEQNEIFPKCTAPSDNTWMQLEGLQSCSVFDYKVFKYVLLASFTNLASYLNILSISVLFLKWGCSYYWWDFLAIKETIQIKSLVQSIAQLALFLAQLIFQEVFVHRHDVYGIINEAPFEEMTWDFWKGALITWQHSCKLALHIIRPNPHHDSPQQIYFFLFYYEDAEPSAIEIIDQECDIDGI